MEELQESSESLKSPYKNGISPPYEKKTDRGLERISILAYEMEKSKIAPDGTRLQPILELAAPTTLKELKQVPGLFANYCRWIMDFSSKINH